ncbi:uncharacterized protein LOC129773114 [Toxorhynchites rutilus septentrionalis]|uniref:uncharacterized protein LOC129773114 n=1 Tax=Toxorhynchites rutilus septentrionalis TaxID=329112 RepID=UPI00247AF7F8|nr:uncharacterized protein LOC129773114 [Toxorhynchites rutilus septentrionalis]
MNLNFLLTEISLQLLDNTFYNVNGQETDNMKDLFSAQNSAQHNNGQTKMNKDSSNNDLLTLLGVGTLDETLLDDVNSYTESQYRGFVANMRERVEAMPGGEESSGAVRSEIHADLCEVRIKARREYVKMLNHSKKMRDIYLDALPHGSDKDWESAKYNEEERNMLLNEYNSLLYLLKHVLADVQDRMQCERALRIIEGARETT